MPLSCQSSHSQYSLHGFCLCVGASTCEQCSTAASVTAPGSHRHPARSGPTHGDCHPPAKPPYRHHHHHHHHHQGRHWSHRWWRQPPQGDGSRINSWYYAPCYYGSQLQPPPDLDLTSNPPDSGHCGSSFGQSARAVPVTSGQQPRAGHTVAVYAPPRNSACSSVTERPGPAWADAAGCCV